MRTVVITKHGGPKVLKVESRPDPTMGPGEVRIAVAAVGINFADVMARIGLYQDAPKPPCALDYTHEGWDVNLPKFDVVLDALAGKSFRRSYEMLAPGGRMVCYGASAVVSGERRNLFTALRTVVRMPRFNLIKQMSDSKAVIG